LTIPFTDKRFFQGGRIMRTAKIQGLLFCFLLSLLLAAPGNSMDRGDTARKRSTLDSRLSPLERRIGKSESRVGESERTLQRFSIQVEELNAESQDGLDSARKAQQTAEAALAGVQAANERISALDDYEEQKSIAIFFPAGRGELSAEARAALDELASQAKTLRGFFIEVAGLGSSEGSGNTYRGPRQKCEGTVVRYLVENHGIPLRRMMASSGYGALQSAGAAPSRKERQSNCRVEVKILVSRGLTMP